MEKQPSREGARADVGPVEPWPTRFAPYVDLLHPLPVVSTVLAAASFTFVAADGPPPLARALPLLTAITLTQLAISLHNDYCDRELDAQAKPWRALPRRLVTPSTAWRWTVVLLALGLLAALPLGVSVLALTAIGTAAGLVYNAYLKRTSWSWLPFWIGLPTLALAAFTAMDRFEGRLWAAYLIGAPLVVSIHLADTLSDIESDTKLGLRGLAHRLGPWRARLTCWGALALAQALVLVLAPGSPLPSPLHLVSAGLIGVAILVARGGALRWHWVAIAASATILALVWLRGIAG